MKKILSLILCTAFAGTLWAGEMRVWTDSKGRTVEAEMVGVQDGKVLMKMATGKTIAFPMDALSAPDQEFVRDNAPVDTMTAARTIDTMVLDKLKASYLEIKEDLAAATSKKEQEDLTFLLKMTWPTERCSDEQFVRRIHLDLAGRIPTYEETVAFLGDPAKDKRARLIDDLLDSEAFVSHFFNFMSDLLRIREGITLNETRELKSGAYADWTKDQIRNNRPWDDWVTEMLTASGFYWENPATGYMLTDQGMALCNLSNTFTVFAGTEITCAQCHDHPFEEVYQMDFFKMAAFFGGVELRGGSRTEEAQLASAKKKEYVEEWKAKNPDARRFDQNLEYVLDAYRYQVTDRPEGTVQLPHDYKYDDAEPKQTVYPAAYFGEIVDLEDYENPRQAFADWLTSSNNPRFTINIVNRLWKMAFGLAQIEPVFNVPGNLDGQAQNYELLKYLEQLMKDLDYDLKGFLRIVFNSATYQREANHHSPTLAQIDEGEYHFPAPTLRRMTAEQLWDSLVALTTPTPEAVSRRLLEDYQNLMRTDWSEVSYDEAFKIRDRFTRLGSLSMGMMEGGDMMAQAGGGERIDDLLVRASERSLPDNVGSLLFTFGQSDKLIIENANKEGSIPQVMYLLNGDLTNQIMVRDSSYVVQTAKGARSEPEAIERVFLSVLNRRPNRDELEQGRSLVRGNDYSDLIWALLNTREFMFIQ